MGGRIIGVPDRDHASVDVVARASTASKINFGTPPASSMITST
jgi:hypothetical protein